MTMKYEILKQAARVLNIKGQWTGMTIEELLENRRRANAKNRIPDLRDDAFEITRIDVMGFPVLKLIHRKKTDCACLFLIGGGMISAPRPGSVRKALRFAKETGLDVYVPYYPLCTEYPITKAYEMIHETYRRILEDYTADHISVLGTSSGGNLALGMVPYINDGHADTPMPGYIMAISPGTCVSTEEEWQRMLVLDEKDVAIPAQYMKTAEEIVRHGDEHVPDYMIWLQKGDFTGCPKVTFIYGSDETLYACAPSFERAMKKYHVKGQMIIGKGMFHCYPVFPVCREAKRGWDMMIRFMKEETKAVSNRKTEPVKYHIEKNIVQETLIIPLLGRLICSEHFPHLFYDPEAERICAMLDFDFEEKRKKMETPAGLFGALEVAQRQYDLIAEAKAYLKDHPQAAVVNLGCGLDDSFTKADNGQCRGYNIDFPDVIRIRNDLLPAKEREKNLACDLLDLKWMEEIDAEHGAVFLAAGVFYYFRTEDLKTLFTAMAERFPGAVLVFDACNRFGAKLMRRTWLREAGITDVNAYFSLEDEKELENWSERFMTVSAKSYMRGYRDIYPQVNLFHQLMIRFCDDLVNMKIVRILFRENGEKREKESQ